MKNVTRKLTKSIEDIIYYKPENSIEEIVKTVFETILKLERDEYLNKHSTFGNKANGFYSRMLKSINNYFRLRIPRDRLSLFKPAFLDILREEEQQRCELAFKLYVKGLSTREIEGIFKDVFNSKYSASSISQINSRFCEEREYWLNRPLEKDYYFLFVDALQVAVRRETVEKEAFYIVLGLRKDLKREILGVYNIPTESAVGWGTVFDDLKSRGLKQTLLVVADGLSGLKEVVKRELPGAKYQRCLVHKIRNILIKTRASDKKEISEDFRQVFELESYEFKQVDGILKLKNFIDKWRIKYPGIKHQFQKDDIDHYFAYLEFPPKIHRMIYTTNWIERLNRNIRRTEKLRMSFPNPESALNLICANLMELEERVYKYPITSFKPVQNKLDDLFYS
jgi:transposase-like protein